MIRVGATPVAPTLTRPNPYPQSVILRIYYKNRLDSFYKYLTLLYLF
jgi:hypothetical protein